MVTAPFSLERRRLFTCVGSREFCSTRAGCTGGVLHLADWMLPPPMIRQSTGAWGVGAADTAINFRPCRVELATCHLATHCPPTCGPSLPHGPGSACHRRGVNTGRIDRWISDMRACGCHGRTWCRRSRSSGRDRPRGARLRQTIVDYDHRSLLLTYPGVTLPAQLLRKRGWGRRNVDGKQR